jgi:hypothetical protein
MFHERLSALIQAECRFAAQAWIVKNVLQHSISLTEFLTCNAK